MRTKSTPIIPGIVTSYDCPKLKQPSTREASGLMVRVLTILYRVILDQQLTFVCSNPWRNATSNASVRSPVNNSASLCILLVCYFVLIFCYLFISYLNKYKYKQRMPDRGSVPGRSQGV